KDPGRLGPRFENAGHFHAGKANQGENSDSATQIPFPFCLGVPKRVVLNLLVKPVLDRQSPKPSAQLFQNPFRAQFQQTLRSYGIYASMTAGTAGHGLELHNQGSGPHGSHMPWIGGTVDPENRFSQVGAHMPEEIVEADYSGRAPGRLEYPGQIPGQELQLPRPAIAKAAETPVAVRRHQDAGAETRLVEKTGDPIPVFEGPILLLLPCPAGKEEIRVPW